MMVPLFDRAEVKRAGILVAHEIAEAIHIEGARTREVGHGEFDVACANHIERRIEGGLADGHCFGRFRLWKVSALEGFWLSTGWRLAIAVFDGVLYDGRA